MKKTNWLLGIAIIFIYLAWGTSFFATRLALAQFSPLLLMGCRALLGGLLIIIFLFFKKTSLPNRKQIFICALTGIVLSGSNSLVAIAQLKVDSSLAGVLTGTVPIWSLLIQWLRNKYLNRQELLCIAIGIIGLFCIFGIPSADESQSSTMLVLVAALGWSFGTFLTHKYVKIDAIPTAAIQLISGGVVLFIYGMMQTKQNFTIDINTPLFALLYLSIFSSALGSIAYNYCVRTGGPILATSYAYVCPIIAILVGATIGKEALSPGTLLGAGFIIISIILSYYFKTKKS